MNKENDWRATRFLGIDSNMRVKYAFRLHSPLLVEVMGGSARGRNVRVLEALFNYCKRHLPPRTLSYWLAQEEVNQLGIAICH